jgi:phytoene dehydrogenase-like protein
VQPPTVQRAYDVCVIGSQLGGVVAGALLARRGFRVLHVDHDGLGTSYSDHGWLLPWAPSLLTPPRLWPAAEAVLGELGLASDVGRQLESCTPDLQVLLPRNSVDLSRDPALRLPELRREWGEDAVALEAALVEAGRLFDAERPLLAAVPPIPPRGLGDRFRLSRARRLSPSGGDGGPAPLAELGDHPLATALRALYPFLSHLDGPPPRLGLVRTLGAALRGAQRLPFGEPGLAGILRRRIADSRGDLLGTEDAPAVVRSLEVSGGKVSSIRLEGAGNVYVARAFVSATSAGILRALLPGGGEKMAALLDEVRTSRVLASANWVVRAGGLPPPLGQTAIGVGASGTAVLLQVLPALRAGKKGMADPSPGERVLTAATFFPAAGSGENPGERLARLRAAVAEFVPFLDRIVVHESMPPSRRVDRDAGTYIHPLFETRAPRALGVGGIATRSPLGNLFFAGRDVLPGLGVEGEFHAGLRAADGVEAALGRKKRPK